jgi:predicted small secreted protein
MYLTIIAAMLAIAVMAGCNTTARAGKDVQSVGPSPDSAEKDGLPCGPRRLQPPLLDFPKRSLRRACV